MNIGELRLNGEERIEVWEKYKKEHPDPEVASAEDFTYLNRMLDVQLLKVIKDGRIGVLDGTMSDGETEWFHLGSKGELIKQIEEGRGEER